MNPRYYALTPCDAWFFRDGRPYHHGESNQADVPSVFPPSPRTISGALRAALARANGWESGARWPSDLNQFLGDGPNDLGTFQCIGPFLIRHGPGGSQALWPMPRHLLGHALSGEWSPRAFLVPEDREFETDLGRVRLPRPAVSANGAAEGLKPTERAWITAQGLSTVLGGQLPPQTDVCTAEHLWALEPRIGLCRAPESLIVGEGDLYSPRYVRLRREVAVGVGINHLPDSLKPLPPLLSFGGESRMAMAEPWPHQALPNHPPLDAFPRTSDGLVRFLVMLLTPGRFAQGNGPVDYLRQGARVVAACVGRPQFIGGWDSGCAQPLPLEPFHPAGSVWFCEAPVGIFPDIHARHGQWLGAYTQHGFGQIAIGLWPANPIHEPCNRKS